MSVRAKLAEIFFETAGDVFLRARSRHFDTRARESFDVAKALMDGSEGSGMRDLLIEETHKPQSPWLARLYYQHAQQMFAKTGRPSNDESYIAVFGVTKEEFDLDMSEASLEVEFPHLARPYDPPKPTQL